MKKRRIIQFAAFLIGLVFIYRAYLCTQVPEVTSDVLRHLGFSSHLLDRGFGIYNAIAQDFLPDTWVGYWHWQGYIYPPLTMVFFALFSHLGLGIFFVKSILTAIDGSLTVYLWKRFGPWVALLFSAMPTSVWYTSHEGQFEALQNLWVVLCLASIDRQRWFLMGLAFGLGIQTKQLAVLILPWLIYQVCYSENHVQGVGKRSVRAGCGVLASFIPFAGFYWSRPDIFLLPFQSQSLTYSPFAWNFTNHSLFGWNPPTLIYYNATVSYTILVSLVVFLFATRFRIAALAQATPLLSFWTILKSLTWAQFWLVISSYPLILCLARYRRFLYWILILTFLQGGRSIVLLSGTHFGLMEAEYRRMLMEKSMYHFSPSVVAEVREGETPNMAP